jgi:hypothetical protein
MQTKAICDFSVIKPKIGHSLSGAAARIDNIL